MKVFKKSFEKKIHNYIVQVVKVNNLKVLEMWVITNQWLNRLRKINEKVCLYPGNIKIELSFINFSQSG